MESQSQVLVQNILCVNIVYAGPAILAICDAFLVYLLLTFSKCCGLILLFLRLLL